MGGFRQTYEGLLTELLRRGHPELNERTGVTIAALTPRSFTVDLSDGKLPVCGVRRTYPRSAAAEVAWFLTGEQDATFIRKYAPLWDKFLEDDGVTVAGAYGHRWRRRFGRDQVEDAIQALSRNPSDRRIYVSAWDPAEDGLGRPSKNVPCPVGFTLSVLDGRLNSALMIRSSDVFVGLPYDVMGHALLMALVASSLRYRMDDGLDLGPGEMHVTLAHPHLYECHREMALEALGSAPSDDTMRLPRSWDVDGVTREPDAFVEWVASMAKGIVQPAYHCRPEVVA